MDYVIGVDIGTQSTKALLCDTTGRIVAQHAHGYMPDTPHPLWAEQWPQVWLDAVKYNASRRKCVDEAQAAAAGLRSHSRRRSARCASAACTAARAFPSMRR